MEADREAQIAQIEESVNLINVEQKRLTDRMRTLQDEKIKKKRQIWDLKIFDPTYKLFRSSAVWREVFQFMED